MTNSSVATNANTQNKKERILQRIQKALALQQSDNANEVAAAARMVAKLMSSYGISQSEIDAATMVEEEITEIVVEVKRQNFYATLGSAIAEFCSCKSAYSHRYNKGKQVKIIKFWGHESDLVIAEYFYTFCLRQIDIEYKAAKKTKVFPPWYQRGDKVRWGNEYRYNAVLGLRSKLREIRSEEKTLDPSGSLVVLDRAQKVAIWCKANTSVRFTKSTGYSHNSSGYNSGRNINIRSGINGKQRRIGGGK